MSEPADVYEVKLCLTVSVSWSLYFNFLKIAGGRAHRHAKESARTRSVSSVERRHSIDVHQGFSSRSCSPGLATVSYWPRYTLSG